jgi:hypothetical protein
MDFNLTDVVLALTDARAALMDAERAIEKALEEMTIGVDAEEQEREQWKILDRHPDVRALYERMRSLRVNMDALWTPALKALLQEEEDWAEHEEELADRGSY